MKHGDKVYQKHGYRIFRKDPITGNYGYETAEKWFTYGPAFRFRAEPVPGIHKYKNSFRDCYRHPKTTQELRLVEPHSEYVRVRGKRTKNHLPTWYDDMPVADYRNSRSWKRTKKKRQWMKANWSNNKMSKCFDYGMNNGCDSSCPHLLDGDCDVPEEVLDDLGFEFTHDELEELKELYGLVGEDYESIW